MASRHPSAAAGEQTEFEKVTGPHWDGAYGLILRMVRNPTTADDLLQETLLRALRCFGGFRDRSRAKAWLLRIAHNTTLNWIRKNQPQIPVDFSEEEPAVSDPAAGDASPVEQAVMDKDQAQRVAAALERLSPMYASILQLRYGEGLSYKELADTLGIPMHSVKFRLHQGVALLRDLVSRAAEFASQKN